MSDNPPRDSESQGPPAVDPALQPEHQHQHTHHHHTTFAEKGREDEIIYSQETGFEKGIVPEPTPLDHASKSQSHSTGDEEAGQTEPAQRSWNRRLMKHWRHAVHLVIWLLFTG